MNLRPVLLVIAAAAALGLSCKNEEPEPPPPPPECGNGLLEIGESCEGLPPPMGCDLATCTVDPGFGCLPEVPEEEESGGEFEPVEWMSTCEPLDTCGDGVIDPEEECDDGDETVADGCSGCRIDPLYTCTGEPSDCFQCGDGFLDPGEDCDDGEEIGSDSPGCENCEVVAGWECFDFQPTQCGPICGDGMWFDTSIPGVTVGFAEGCDDGNLTPGDGCDENCRVEDDCDCTGSPPGIATCVCGLGTTTTGADSGTDSGSGSDSGTTGGSSDTGGSSSSDDGGVMSEVDSGAPPPPPPPLP